MIRNRSLDYLQNEKRIDSDISIDELDEELVQEEREIFLLNKRDGLKYKEIGNKITVTTFYSIIFCSVCFYKSHKSFFIVSNWDFV